MNWKEFFREKPRTPIQQARNHLFAESMIVFVSVLVLAAIVNLYLLPPESKQYIRVEDMMNVALVVTIGLTIFKLVDVIDVAYKLHKLKKGEIKQ